MDPQEPDFEVDRNQRIQRNQKILESIGVCKTVESLARKSDRRKHKRPDVDKNHTVRRSSRLKANENRLDHEKSQCYATASEESGSQQESDETESSEAPPTTGSDSEFSKHAQEGSVTDDSVDEERDPHGGKDAVAIEKTTSVSFLRFQNTDDEDDEEVKKAYLMFAKEGGGLMTMRSVTEIAKNLNVHLDEDQRKAMEEYATSKTSCHPQCLTLSEFRSLIKALK